MSIQSNPTIEAQLKSLTQELDDTVAKLEEVYSQLNLKIVEAELTEIELTQILNASIDGMWVIDFNHEILRVNTTMLKLLDKQQHEVIGNKCYSFFHSSICNERRCPMIRIKEGDDLVQYDINLPCQGKIRHYSLTATPFLGLLNEIIGVVEIYRDITLRKKAELKLKEANKRLKELVHIDGLTELANRRYFDFCLEKEWKRSCREHKPISLIMCDIDFFKRFNDTYGHQAGDDCLKLVANTLRIHARRPGDVAARYGGEEFGFILPNTDVKGALYVAESIRKHVEELGIAHIRSDIGQHVTISLGVSGIVPCNQFTPEALIEYADKALYSAKTNGRNRVFSSHVEY
ncbi:MAG: diguanylate cyclase [Desulfobacterales bacterium]|nr:diguanylate cyclase [Desulfobacterales bacterium]